MRHLLSSWQHRLQSRSDSPLSSHFLDLRQHRGGLHQRCFDLPSPRPDEQLHYLRRQERWQLPASYRTGLAFFATVLLVSVMGISAFDARGMAESRQAAFGAQILQEFDALATELEQYSPGVVNIIADQESPSRHEEVFSNLQTDQVLLEPSFEGALTVKDYQYSSSMVDIGLDISKGFRAFEQGLQTWNESSTASGSTLIRRFEDVHQSAQQALKNWNEALEIGGTLADQELSSLQAGQLQYSLARVRDLVHILDGFDQLAAVMPQILGQQEPQRILVLLQNSDQLRASGGSLSAGVEILVEDGEILTWKPFHTQEYDDQLQAHLQPPVGLKDLTDRWNLRTANAFVNGPQSAQQVNWFWQREARSSLDLVVLVNTSAFERLFADEALVAALAPEKASELQQISLRWSAYQLSNNTEALKTQASLLVEQSLALLKRPDLILQALPTLMELAQEKQVLVNGFHAELQSALETFRLTGSLPSPEAREDFLMVSSINTATNGSDRWIEPHHELHTSIEDDGSIKHWLKIDLNHRWSDDMMQGLRDEIGFPVIQDVLRRLSYDDHHSLMRVLVPRGSTLNATGAMPLEEVSSVTTGAFTVWSFPVSVRSGKTSTVELFYTLPWTFDTQTVDNYRLHLVRQAGNTTPFFSHHLKLPEGVSLFQELPEGPIVQLDRDQVLAVVAGKNP